MGLKQIKNQIKSTQKTSKVTKAMEAVSAVKMRKSQLRALDGRSYAEAALRILGRVSGSLDAKNHPLTSPAASVHIMIFGKPIGRARITIVATDVPTEPAQEMTPSTSPLL